MNGKEGKFMYNDYRRMVLDFYVERLRDVRRRRAEAFARIRRPAQALAYRKKVRAAVRRAFSPVPAKTPLNARMAGVVDRPAYRIEKLIFDSRPGCWVTANLYLPKRDGPVPGVLGPCGHSKLGKAEARYQAFAQRLATAGFAVLMYEPFNQGERDQYVRLPERRCVEGCCQAHNMMGKQMGLLADYYGMWRVWDGIRGLDYLLTRPEIDPRHLGVTGNSGGGTLSSWLWACEDRLTMAAPSCFITTFERNLENEVPTDAEQYPPGVVGAGLEMVDLLIAAAPKPILLVGQALDFFDRRGLDEAYADLRRFYRVLGAPAKDAALFIGPQDHGYYNEGQEAMVEFFCRRAGIRAWPKLEQTEALKPEELFATPGGNVIQAGATPVYELLAAQADAVSAGRRALSGVALRKILARLLNMPGRKGVPHYRVLRPMYGADPCARYAVETERSVVAILRKLPAAPSPFVLDVGKEIGLYLPHVSSEQDLVENPHAKALAKPGPVYALDPRGIGESAPEGDFSSSYGMDYMFHGHGVLFGESYLGRRVFDVLRTMDLLADRGAEKIRVTGRGQGAILALFAGLLHESADSVTLINGPRSFDEWVRAPLVAWPAANFLRGALRHFDLPDCVRVLGSRVRVVDPWGPDMAS
ncbi:MAG: hypothetical protein V1809_01420 [Planctomycetota bacterium]